MAHDALRSVNVHVGFHGVEMMHGQGLRRHQKESTILLLPDLSKPFSDVFRPDLMADKRRENQNRENQGDGGE